MRDGGPYIVQRPVRANGTSLLEVSLFANDGGDTTGGQSCSTGSYQDCKLFEELSLLIGRLDTKEMGEDTDNGE